nr:immunoglobulin heavy chain junction region [Mus musculus]
CAIRLPDYW